VTDLRWWLRSFQRSAFRLEALPAYHVPQEAEWFAEWQRSGRLPELTPDNDSWCKLVREAKSAGRLMQRVRVVSSPLTDYERFELAMFRDSVAAGEDIRIAERRVITEFDDLTDFWAFDGQVILLHYDPVGRFLGTDHINDAVAIVACQRIRDTALSRSIRLQEYLAKL
jgi:hypothetical protein